MMNLTELREELDGQASEMASRHPDLLPGIRRRARRNRAVRTTTAAAAIAVVAIGSTLVVPTLLPSRDDVPAFEPPVAATPTTEPPRVPIQGVMRGNRIELEPGFFFTVRGKTWRLDDTGCPRCQPDETWTLQPPRYGRQGATGQRQPGADRLFTIDIVQGEASRVVYTVRVPNQPPATYAADVYDLPSWPGWTLAYVDFPKTIVIDQAGDETKLDVTFRAYDAAGRYLRQVPPTHPVR